MTVTTSNTTNEYWDAVRHLAKPDRFYGGPCIDTYGAMDRIARDGDRLDRFELCGRYSWTITDPDTVAFVVEHVGQMVIDPMAGSGWWAHLLRQAGVAVSAYDINPPDGTEANHWHRGESHVQITRLDGVSAVATEALTATLLLSWPPYDREDGAEILRAYRGNRVVYIGEGDGGCCGTGDLFDQLRTSWTEVAEIRPVQFYGIHDYVTVYDRNQ